MGTKQKHCDPEPSLIDSNARPKHNVCGKRLRILGFEGETGIHYTLSIFWFCEKCCHVIHLKVTQVTYP